MGRDLIRRNFMEGGKDELRCKLEERVARSIKKELLYES